MTVLYYLSWLEAGSIPVAEATDDPFRDRALASSNSVHDWQVLRLTIDSDTLVDYQPNNAGVRLCSKRMRHVIDGVLGPRDHAQWLPAVVADVFGVEHGYNVMHVPDLDDVLDDDASLVVDGFTVKPVLSIAKTEGRNVMRVPESILTLIVSEKVRQAILNAGCSGINFEKAAAI